MPIKLKEFFKNGRTIYGAALNYKDPNGDQSQQIEEPVIFHKSPSGYITEGSPIIVKIISPCPMAWGIIPILLIFRIPKNYKLVEELELGIIIGKTCKNINEAEAIDYIGGYCVGLDMTAINELTKCRSNGSPWTCSKSFDTSCPVSEFISKEAIADPDDVELWCSINGRKQQQGNTKNLVFSSYQLISFISQTQTLLPNDLILVGTPPSPGLVKAGDIIEGGIKGVKEIKFVVENYYEE